jgi:hypothetical protein
MIVGLITDLSVRLSSVGAGVIAKKTPSCYDFLAKDKPKQQRR